MGAASLKGVSRKRSNGGGHAETSGARKAGLPSERQKLERKYRVLTRGTPSVVGSIASAIVTKNENLFFLSRPDGSVPIERGHGFGLYYHDCRFLNGYELRLAGAVPHCLVSTAANGDRSAFQLTNPDIRMGNGRLIEKEEIGVKWERTLNVSDTCCDETITIENFKREAVDFGMTLTFRSEFEDVFAIRGLLPENLGRRHRPRWKNNNLIFTYDGRDQIQRRLTIVFSPVPEATRGARASFRIQLDPGSRCELSVHLFVNEVGPEHTPHARSERDLPRKSTSPQESHNDCAAWIANGATMTTDSTLLNMVLERSFLDLCILRSRLNGEEYFAAGLPWFGTLFGRDSLITALETLFFDPKIAENTLRLLAQYQCRQIDDWRDGQPGKILHELRVGEMARTGEIPHTPYYGAIDTTPLFLILLAQHANWTGDLSLFSELRQSVDLALQWMSQYGDLTGDGYISYSSTSEKGLINQGWKDSGDAIVDSEGKIAKPPIAMAEVQGYAYLAMLSMATLYERIGDRGRTEDLQSKAAQLRDRFNRDYWLEDQGVYAIALQNNRHAAAVVSSNAGQVLWSGIAEQKKALRTMQRLMAPDMFNGWGIRTLSQKERRYNPVGYHLGTVWPHDNALIAAGCRRYGFDEYCLRIFEGILGAAIHFEHYRLPELFAGFHRDEFGVPVHFPVACHPQAWAAGSVPFMMQNALGLMPDAFNQKLHIAGPTLPEYVERVELHRLRVGAAVVDLTFRKTENGRIRVEVPKCDGPLDVIPSEDEASRFTLMEHQA